MKQISESQVSFNLTGRVASPVHDIGKIGIPDKVLLKEGKLDKEEWEIMKQHCVYGKKILDTNKFIKAFKVLDVKNGETVSEYAESFKVISTASNIAMSHHEHYDGNGYPEGLRRDEIPMEARITAIADVYDALRSERPYKQPWPEEKCIQFINEKRGTQFDPDVTDVFMDNLDIINKIRETYKN